MELSRRAKKSPQIAVDIKILKTERPTNQRRTNVTTLTVSEWIYTIDEMKAEFKANKVIFLLLLPVAAESSSTTLNVAGHGAPYAPPRGHHTCSTE